MTQDESVQFSIWRHQYIENAYYYRGKLIDTFNLLEKSIEQLLMDFFTPEEKRIHFRFIVLDRLTFQAKKESLAALINIKSSTEGFTKTKNNSWPTSKLFEEIRFAQEKRNEFAHYPLIIPEHISDNVIVLAEMRDGKGLIEYDLKKYFDTITKIQAVTIEVNRLI